MLHSERLVIAEFLIAASLLVGSLFESNSEKNPDRSIIQISVAAYLFIEGGIAGPRRIKAEEEKTLSTIRRIDQIDTQTNSYCSK